MSLHNFHLRDIGLAMLCVSFVGAASAARAQDAIDSCEILHAIPATSETGFVDVTNNKDAEDLQRYITGKATPLFQSTTTKVLELADSELKDLASRAAGYSFGNFEPICNWAEHGKDRQSVVMKFTRPLLSSDGKLAIIGVSRMWTQRGGNGLLCVARKSPVGWTAKCTGTWIT